jgi:isopentenyl diphosphate isomerase/L-lactate dehydrogenase-like FMN-dependent dehydrogenase
LKGEQAVLDWIAAFELELRTAVFLAGVKRAADLPRAAIVITGDSRAWMEQLGYRRRAAGGASRRSR